MSEDDMEKLVKAIDALQGMDVVLEDLTSLGHGSGKYKDLDGIYDVLQHHSHPAYSVSAEDDAFYEILTMTDKSPKERVEMLLGGPDALSLKSDL